MPVPETCLIEMLGPVDYQRAWEYQERLGAEIGRGERPPTLLLLEHPHTFTFGRGGRAEHLLWEESELQRRGVGVYWVDRGGDVTYHGPGQLVGYPLLPLGGLRPGGGNPARPGSNRLPGADYLGYLRRLERTLILALNELGVAARQLPGLSGVWVNGSSDGPPAKIAALGVKVDARGVSRHGFALNVNPEMEYWQGIIGCGLQGYPTTCLADLLPSLPGMEEIQQAIISAFGAVFGYRMVVSDQAGRTSPRSDIPG